MTHYAPIPRFVQSPAYVCVTLRLADASDDLLVRHVRLMRDCVALAQQRWGFGIEAAVVLPNEMQILCSFSDAQFGVRGAIRLIMKAFSRHLPGVQGDTNGVIWAGAAEMIEIATDAVPVHHAFVEAAPVRAGLVKRPQDWPYSSAHRATSQASDIGVAVA